MIIELHPAVNGTHNRLRELRMASSLTPIEVAEETGIDKRRLYGYERQDRDIPVDHLNRLAAFHGVSLAYAAGIS